VLAFFKHKILDKTNKKINSNRDILDSLSDVGLSRGNNEDSVITITHPGNPSLKLLAVADGVGGKENGEVASSFAIDTLREWFINTPGHKLENSNYLKRNIEKTIKFINNFLYLAKNDECSTTLTCAVINANDTIIANVGDSRAYIVTGEEMTQVTRDDSLVWYYYEQGELSKDQIRFHKGSSLITKSIGSDLDVDPEISRIPNKNYKGLLLCTDGVTDCLSDSKLAQLVIRGRKSNLAQNIINEAVYGNPPKRAPKGKEFHIPMNGKDNASVALYLKTS